MKITVYLIINLLFFQEEEIIKRTCISQFQVNLFMVDRGCMQERSKTGHICFCEEELCNKSSQKKAFYIPYFFLILMLGRYL